MEHKTIIDDASAIFKPGTATLVLGPPGCGKVWGKNNVQQGGRGGQGRGWAGKTIVLRAR